MRNRYRLLAMMLGVFCGLSVASQPGERWLIVNRDDSDAIYERREANGNVSETLPRPSGTLASNIVTERADERAELDLRAQRQMSAWAFLTMLATVLGVFLVYRTLRETKAALAEAKRAADAAVETVEVTREMGEAQVRGYFAITRIEAGINLTDGVGLTSIRVTIRNSGNSPGRGVVFSTEVVRHFWPRENVEGLALLHGMKDIESENYVLRPLKQCVPGQDTVYHLFVKDPGFPEDRSRYRFGHASFRGTVFIKDVFDRMVAIDFLASAHDDEGGQFPWDEHGWHDLAIESVQERQVPRCEYEGDAYSQHG